MKKHIVALTAIAALSVGAAGQASASTVHTVEKGDTLWAISRENNVSVQDLQEWNELDSTLIYPLQQLKVEETHVVLQGETLFQIALLNGLSVDELMESNQLTSDLIFPGDELVIEGTKKVESKVDSASLQTAPVTNTTENTSAPATEKTAAPAPAPEPAEAKTTTPAPAPAPATVPTVKTAEPATTKTTAPAPATVKNSAPAESTAKELTVTSTAYTASCEGCSGVTATGIDLNANPNQKVISVDPSVIPLGSRVWVEGYGEAIAGDTGGAIKGNKIDIFIPDKQDAINWGRKTVKVKILD
ncbi:LysM peptidoglycan-binding domain-containing protein [Psychrobacillus sp. FJAT-51614]|uniref:LysM peptidoglycan-binding domain-containing protein n=1 Tax=Psychrobacillus mangrovi TaxID=3117745 RepID=A0ABU8F471_9BACI